MERDHAELLGNLGWVRALAHGLLQDAGRAEDVAQEVFVTALERPPRARSGPGLRAWLARVARSLARQSVRGEQRRARRERAAGREEALASAADVVERAATQRQVIAAVMALEEPERATLLHHYLDGLSAGAIARRRGESAEAVRKRLSRARARLRERLERELGGRDGLLGALVPFAEGWSGAAAPGVAGGLLVLACGLLVIGGALAWWIGRPGAAASASAEVAATLPAPPALLPPGRDGAGLAGTSARTPLALAAGRIALEGTVRTRPYPAVEPPPDEAVEVTLVLGRPGAFQDRTEAKTTADASGAFRFELADPGRRPLEASLSVAETALHRDAFERRTLAEGERVLAGIELERVAHGTLRGIVLDSRGTPVPDARVVFEGTSGFLDAEPEQRVTAVADAGGRFALESFRGADEARAEAPGRRQIDASRLAKLEQGGWEPLTLVLGPVGALAVSVQDAGGQALEGVRVALDVSPDEPRARREGGWGDGPRATLEEASDADGRLFFPEVWSEVELRVRVSSDWGTWESERRREGVLLLPEAGAPAEALVVPSGAAEELVVRLPPPAVVRGTVRHPDRAPAAGAQVHLALHRAGEAGAPSAEVETDGEGRFEWRQLFVPPPDGLTVTAVHPPIAIESYQADENAAFAAAVRELGAAELERELEPLELVLEPVLSIHGSVRRADGAPPKGYVSYRRPRARTSTRLASGGARLREDGSFTLAGLLPGAHDLEVLLSEDFFFTWSRLPRRFPAIEAGTSGLELVVGEPAVARVTIDATLDGRPVSFDRVLGFCEPREPRAPAGAVPPREATFRRLDGWPAPATLTMLGGQAGAVDSLGSHRFMYLGTARTVQPPVADTVQVVPGWYWIGVRGWEESFRAPLHPSGAGLVFLEPGDYRFHFELVRTGELRGRVAAAAIEPDLCVALVDAQGGPVLTRRRSHTMDSVSPTGADGSFWLQGAPVGAFTLRVGSEAELRAGVARTEQAVTIRAGENPPLEVRLP